VSSGRVWKSREKRQHYIIPAFRGGSVVSLQRHSNSRVYSEGVSSRRDSKRPADIKGFYFSQARQCVAQWCASDHGRAKLVRECSLGLHSAVLVKYCV